MTKAEIEAFDRGYREGVQTVLDYASRTADKLDMSSKRMVHEGFATASLRGLVEACQTLLLAPAGSGRKEAA